MLNLRLRSYHCIKSSKSHVIACVQLNRLYPVEIDPTAKGVSLHENRSGGEEIDYLGQT
jgi:hypothetical protein